MELIAGMQSKRMDEQRVTLPYLPGLNSNQDSDDSFIEMLVKCQVCIIILLYIIKYLFFALILFYYTLNYACIGFTFRRPAKSFTSSINGARC